MHLSNIHSAATTELLKLAFAQGDMACETGSGYEFIVTVRSGAQFTGAPLDTATAENIGRVFTLMSGDHIMTHEIVAIRCIEL